MASIIENLKVRNMHRVPNFLTAMRILLVPVLIFAFYLPIDGNQILASGIFLTASFTDWLDGNIARRWQITSSFGAFLDPIADKLLVASSLLLLVGCKDIPYITLPAIVIVGREIVVSGLREWMAEVGKRKSVAVSFLGKFKTAIQMIAIALLLAYHPQESSIGMAGFFLLYIAAILTIWSMIIYITFAWPELTDKNNEKKC